MLTLVRSSDAQEMRVKVAVAENVNVHVHVHVSAGPNAAVFAAAAVLGVVVVAEVGVVMAVFDFVVTVGEVADGVHSSFPNSVRFGAAVRTSS